MFHRDQTELFGTGNTSKPHRMPVFTASLPILTPLSQGFSPGDSGKTESIPTCSSPPPPSRIALTSIQQ
jgi:hypothetical protein